MTLKDLKGNFLNHTTTRLLSPYNQIPIKQNKYSFIQKAERAWVEKYKKHYKLVQK